MSSASSSSTRNPPQKQYTPPSDSPSNAATPRTGSALSDGKDDDDGDLEVHGEDDYELQPLKRRVEKSRGNDDEHDDSGQEDGDEDSNGGDEVLYAADEPSEPDSPGQLRTPPRMRRAQKREFLYTRKEERAVVKKLDRYLVGGLALLYMLRYGARQALRMQLLMQGILQLSGSKQ